MQFFNWLKQLFLHTLAAVFWCGLFLLFYFLYLISCVIAFAKYDWFPNLSIYLAGLLLSFILVLLAQKVRGKQKKKTLGNAISQSFNENHLGSDTNTSKMMLENSKALPLEEYPQPVPVEDFQEVSQRVNQDKSLSVYADRGYLYWDELLPSAVDVVLETGQSSVSIIQRRLKLGYTRSAKIIDEMEELGFIGPFLGSRPRSILLSEKDWKVISHKMIIIDDVAPVSIPQYEPKKAERSLDAIDGMDGHSFEWLCADLLRCDGFIDVTVTPGSGDQGVDIVAQKDGVRYAIQCKCYSSDLGNKPVQEVYAGKEMYGCQVAAVMTNRFFTSGAKQLAEKTRVLLWDRNYLTRLVEKSKESNSSNQSFS